MAWHVGLRFGLIVCRAGESIGAIRLEQRILLARTSNSLSQSGLENRSSWTLLKFWDKWRSDNARSYERPLGDTGQDFSTQQKVLRMPLNDFLK